MVPKAVATAKCLAAVGVEVAVINARYLRPLDEALIHPMAKQIGKIVTMEEGALAGGFGSAVLESLLIARALSVAVDRLTGKRLRTSSPRPARS